MWVVSDDGKRLLVCTGADTWKAKRLRHDPRVRVAASDGRGNAKGDAFLGSARLVDEGELVIGLLRNKYGWQKRGLDAFNSFMRRMQRRPKARRLHRDHRSAAGMSARRR